MDLVNICIFILRNSLHKCIIHLDVLSSSVNFTEDDYYDDYSQSCESRYCGSNISAVGFIIVASLLFLVISKHALMQQGARSKPIAGNEMLFNMDNQNQNINKVEMMLSSFDQVSN